MQVGNLKEEDYQLQTVPKIQIVKAPPGPTTTERVGELIQNYPEGTTVRELSHQLNRPVSMVQHCLKSLISSGQVYVRLSENGMQRVYYPSSTGEAIAKSR